MTNGVNAIFGGFEYSYHITDVRNVFRAYFISLGVSLLMSLFLIVTITSLILYQVALSKIDEKGWLNTTDLNLFYLGKIAVFLVMIFTIISLLFRYGTKQGKDTKILFCGCNFNYSCIFIYVLFIRNLCREICTIQSIIWFYWYAFNLNVICVVKRNNSFIRF